MNDTRTELVAERIKILRYAIDKLSNVIAEGRTASDCVIGPVDLRYENMLVDFSEKVVETWLAPLSLTLEPHPTAPDAMRTMVCDLDHSRRAERAEEAT